jgi:hypothetical protein
MVAVAKRLKVRLLKNEGLIVRAFALIVESLLIEDPLVRMAMSLVRRNGV